MRDLLQKGKGEVDARYVINRRSKFCSLFHRCTQRRRRRGGPRRFFQFKREFLQVSENLIRGTELGDVGYWTRTSHNKKVPFFHFVQRPRTRWDTAVSFGREVGRNSTLKMSKLPTFFHGNQLCAPLSAPHSSNYRSHLLQVYFYLQL